MCSFSSKGKTRGVLGRSGCCTYKDEILFNLGRRKLSGGGTAQHFLENSDEKGGGLWCQSGSFSVVRIKRVANRSKVQLGANLLLA